MLPSIPIHEIFLEEVPSTNSYLISHQSELTDWTVVTAKQQTAGRGYAGNSWHSTKNQNLTFSILIRPKCEISHLFYLNKMVSNSIHQVLHAYIPNQIKWPNDIIVNNKKMGGVLIENGLNQGLKYSVIGIGLNINQIQFENLPKATSLKLETGVHNIIDEIRYPIISSIQKNMKLIENQHFKEIDNYYKKQLYRCDLITSFKFDNEIQSGIIRDTNSDGELCVEMMNGIIRNFKLKEIELLY